MAPDSNDNKPRTGGSRGRGRRQPAGIERATRSRNAPPRPSTDKRAPKRPDLPRDEEAHLPRAVFREIRKHAVSDPEDVALALSIGSEAIDEGLVDVALPYLKWAKHKAPRSSAIREALGVALYLQEDFQAAASELQTYRRFTGREDQNHVLADCYRALGRGTDRVAELVEAMADDASDDRYTEGIIVWASALADAGDVAAGEAVLRPRLEQIGSPSDPSDAAVRLWYVAGDLAARSGDRDAAIGWFERVLANGDEVYDAGERLKALRG